MSEKYLSIVVYSRNDNHGKSLLQRMQLCVHNFLEQLERNKIESEVIVIDYNPPKGKELLKDILKPHKKLDFTELRYIIVPREFHMQFENSDKLPIHNMVARNIGVSRSKSEFVLCSCIDILLSNELIKTIAEKKLEKNVLYRINRTDVHRDVIEIKGIDEQLQYCENHIIDVHFDTEFGNQFYDTSITFQHSNQSGDFQLAHKSLWEKVNGYPVYDLMGTHADTILCYMMKISGARQHVFEEPLRIYHIDHDSRWLWPVYTKVLRTWRMLSYDLDQKDIEELKKDFYNLAKKAHKMSGENSTLENMGIPLMTKDAYHKIILDMESGKRSYKFNNHNWGFKEEEFKEFILKG